MWFVWVMFWPILAGVWFGWSALVRAGVLDG